MDTPTPLQRLFLAFYAFFAVLFRAEVAAAVARLHAQHRAALGPARREAEPTPGPSQGNGHAPPLPAPAAADRGERLESRTALYLLGVLQREGRFLDFIEEDVASYPDAAVGAAARTVHEGCRRALRDLLEVEPVLREPEGATVTVERGFDAGAIRLTGTVVGAPPFRGALRHHGWRARDVKRLVPPEGLDPTILAPAEVEL